MNCDDIRRIQGEYLDLKNRLADTLEALVKDVVVVEEIEPDYDSVDFRTGTACQCSNRGCWYKYHKCVLSALLEGRLVKTESDD